LHKIAALRPFEAHGVDFTGTVGNQAYGRCPFADKPDKFYVNVENQLWDSKVTGKSGNLSGFLRDISEVYEDRLSEKKLTILARSRGLPVEAFIPWRIGHTGRVYTFLVSDQRSRPVDIRMYQVGGPVMTTAGCHPGLFGAERMTKPGPVYICEGEWDAIALDWLRAKLKMPGVVVGAPGAAIFKKEWANWFVGRDAVVLFDHDDPGRHGELRVQRVLGGVARSLKYLHWPKRLETGYDLRDLITDKAVGRREPSYCWNWIETRLRPYTRTKSIQGTDVQSQNPEPPQNVDARPSAYKEPASLDKVKEVYKKWLFVDDLTGLEVVLATALSSQLEGDPIWLFLVAPSGGAKTETLQSLSLHPLTYLTSSLTPHSLISGAVAKNGSDPSLIPKLDGKVLVVKDFTSILSMRENDKDEIFGILRDAYDGKCSKVFGTGIVRSYDSRFTVIAGVTPAIYEFSRHYSSLGERFVNFCLGDSLKHKFENEVITKAISNINAEPDMRWELQDVVRSFLSRNIDKHSPPALPKALIIKIIHLAKFGARMRGSVGRDRFRPDIVVSRPSAEVGSRLGKQLAKLTIALAMVRDKDTVSETEYVVAKKVVLDTIPQRLEDMIKYLYKSEAEGHDARTPRDITNDTRYPLATINRMLADMHALDMVVRSGTVGKVYWGLSDYVRNCINGAGLYTSPTDLARPKQRVIIETLPKANFKNGPSFDIRKV
jgi:hypothetical protein